MTKRMLIDASHSQETRVVVLDADRIQEFDLTTVSKHQIKGNIYLAKITRVEPSLQAAFVEYGGGKQGFLPFAEIHPDYYQIPVSDRLRLMEEALGDDAGTEMPLLTGEIPDAIEGELLPPIDENATEAAPYASLIRVLRSAPLQESAALLSQEMVARIEQGDDAFIATDVVENAIEAPLVAAEASVAMVPEGEAVPHVAAASEGEATEFVEHDRAEGAQIESVGSAEDETVETIGDDDDMMQQEQRRRTAFARRYRIQEVVKRGQIILVQVIKEERGNKGVSLSTYISLAGRYCVLMPNSTKGGGISRKIAGGEHRKRLRELVSELSEPDGMSVIIRTAGMDRSTQDIRRDYDYLVRLWNQVRATTIDSTAPALIHEEGDIIKRSIRDMYTSDIEEVIVSGAQGYHEARDFMEMLMPAHGGRVVRYADPMPLFHRYGVEQQLNSMFETTARLRSGGYLVINPTEALISIDVNSGRSTGERNIEETARKTNLEAAEELARQLRLRDLAGLIVIDFIDMMESRNRRAVERALKDALRTDRAKIQIGRISPFGLLEMSRQRLRPSIAEASMVTCSHCEGKGVLRADNNVAVHIIRAVEHELALGACDELRVQTSASVAMYVLNAYRKSLTELEDRTSVAIRIEVNDKIAADAYQIERIGGAPIREEQRRPVRERPERATRPDRSSEDRGSRAERGEGEERRERSERPERGERPERAERSERGERGRRRRSPGGDRGPASAENAVAVLDADGVASAEGVEINPESLDGEGGTRRRRSRGGRRRRGGRDDRDEAAVDGVAVATDGAAEGEDAVAADGTPTEGGERGRRRRGGRNRRGGEGRRRREEGDVPVAAGEDYVPEPGVIAAVPAANPRWSESRGAQGSANASSVTETVSGNVMSFAPSSVSPAASKAPALAPLQAVPAVAPSNEQADPNKPKRFGWWRK